MYNFLGKCLFMYFAHFVIGSFGFLLVNFESCLYIPDTILLLNMWLCIFSSRLFTESFGEQKFLILIKSKPSTFSFFFFNELCFSVKSKNFLPRPKFQRFFFYAFYKKLIVLKFTFTFYSFTVCTCEHDSFWANFYIRSETSCIITLSSPFVSVIISSCEHFGVQEYVNIFTYAIITFYRNTSAMWQSSLYHFTITHPNQDLIPGIQF